MEVNNILQKFFFMRSSASSLDWHLKEAKTKEGKAFYRTTIKGHKDLARREALIFLEYLDKKGYIIIKKKHGGQRG